MLLRVLCLSLFLCSLQTYGGFFSCQSIVKNKFKKIKVRKKVFPSRVQQIEEQVFESGDYVGDLAHGDLIQIESGEASCLARRNLRNRLNFDCVDNRRNYQEKIKMPCLYKDKLYMHGDLIPVSAGVWIYYRGEAVPIEPGKLLIW